MVTCWNHVVFDGLYCFNKNPVTHETPWRTAKTPSWALGGGLNPPKIPSPEAKDIILVVTRILWFCTWSDNSLFCGGIFHYGTSRPICIMTIMTWFCTCFSLLFLWLNLYSMPAGLRVSLVPRRCRCYCKADQQERSVQSSNWGSIDANVFLKFLGGCFFFKSASNRQRSRVNVVAAV